MFRTPDVLWAQRTPHVFLTVDLPNVDAATAKIDLTEDSLHFHGNGGIDQSEYDTTINFFAPINLELSTKGVRARNVILFLVKKEEKWWPKLIKEGKLRNVKIDWNNWKEEDEVDEGDSSVPNDFDMGGMGGFGGPGMGGGGFTNFF